MHMMNFAKIPLNPTTLVCPFPECEETQLEAKNRDDHVKNCQHRLFDCAMFSGLTFCQSKVTIRGCLKHFEEAHKNKTWPNIEGQILYRIAVNDTNINGTKSHWTPYITEFDEHSFILRFY